MASAAFCLRVSNLEHKFILVNYGYWIIQNEIWKSLGKKIEWNINQAWNTIARDFLFYWHQSLHSNDTVSVVWPLWVDMREFNLLIIIL